MSREITKKQVSEVLQYLYIQGVLTDGEYKKIVEKAIKYYEESEEAE